MTAAARYGIVPAMLGTRILTALILIPLVLAALFLLPPFGWATAALAAIAVAAVEWARLAGSGQRGQAVFAACVVGIVASVLVLIALHPYSPPFSAAHYTSAEVALAAACGFGAGRGSFLSGPPHRP